MTIHRLLVHKTGGYTVQCERCLEQTHSYELDDDSGRAARERLQRDHQCR